MAARLKDIARDLGVSVVTVSKALRNHEDISESTRERVLKRIKELNYQPNQAARALVTGKTNLIGLVVPDLVHPFFAQLAKGISRVLRERGYGLVISSSEEDADLEKQEIAQMVTRRLDALLIASAQSAVESFRYIEEQQRRYVLVDRRFSGLHANFVGTDDVAVGRMATNHLLENGCERVAFMGGRYISTAVGRQEGYRNALTSAGRPVGDQYIACRDHSDDSGDLTGYQAMRDLFSLSPRPDAVFCANDPLAMGAMKYALKSGLRIPEDVAIIGVGNVNYASALHVPLSSIDQESERLGEAAAGLALNLIQDKDSRPPEEILIQPRLVVRKSSSRAQTLTARAGA
ncbi:MAG: LacI family transcriptional regulator [Acidobacteriota bacterium]|nr:LacI family transcriptional regulator [Acidobacteriota bacterium]